MATDDADRRYTDREVALVLRRAAELEEQEPTPASGRGLSKRELQDIATEAGFSAVAVDRALTELAVRGGPTEQSLLGTSPSTRVARAVPGRLNANAMQRLIGIVEDRVAATGTVSEALGTVRWTTVPSGHKLNRTTQVAFTPADHETHIQITQRYAPALRTILHALPGAWGGMLGLGGAASAGLVSWPAGLVALASAILGGAIGRGIWEFIARRNADAVRRLAETLAVEARRLASGDA